MHKPHHMPEQSTACAPFACLQAQVSALQSKLAAVEANGGGEGSKSASSAAHHETITQLEKQVRVSWSKKEKKKDTGVSVGVFMINQFLLQQGSQGGFLIEPST